MTCTDKIASNYLWEVPGFHSAGHIFSTPDDL